MDSELQDTWRSNRTLAYNLDPQEIRSKLKKLYYHYTCVGSRATFNTLTPTKFAKMITDAGIIDSNLTRSNIDIIILKEVQGKKNVTFEKFCQVLTRLAREKFEDLYYRSSATDALLTLLDTHLFSLYDSLRENSDIELFEREDLAIDEETLSIIKEISPVLLEIYNRHFPWEAHQSADPELLSKRSEQSMLSLIVSHNITPTFITRKTAFKIWQDLVVQDDENLTLSLLPFDDQGTAFTFKKFVLFIIRCALIAHTNRPELGSSEKLTILLERIEMSQGFHDLERLNNRTHISRMTLLPTSRINEFLETRRKDQLNQTETSLAFESNLADAELTILSLDQSSIGCLDRHIETLQHIFKVYASLGEPMNNKRLKSYKFVKILTDSGVIDDTSRSIINEKYIKEEFNKADANIVFTRITNVKPKGKNDGIPSFKPTSHLAPKSTDFGRMNFNQFLKALEAVACKIFPTVPLDDAYLHLIEDYVLKLESQIEGHGISNAQIKKLVKMLKEPSMVDLMQILHRTLVQYYKHYTDSKGFMNFERWIRFSTDFGLFPDIVAKSKLVTFFNTLVAIHQQTKQTKYDPMEDALPIDQIDTEVIDEYLFIDCVALCGLEGSLSETDPVLKICKTLEKMSQSQGPNIVQMKTGHTRSGIDQVDFLTSLRERYPMVKKIQNTNIGFDEILAGSPQQRPYQQQTS